MRIPTITNTTSAEGRRLEDEMFRAWIELAQAEREGQPVDVLDARYAAYVEAFYAHIGWVRARLQQKQLLAPLVGTVRDGDGQEQAS